MHKYGVENLMNFKRYNVLFNQQSELITRDKRAAVSELGLW